MPLAASNVRAASPLQGHPALYQPTLILLCWHNPSSQHSCSNFCLNGIISVAGVPTATLPILSFTPMKILKIILATIVVLFVGLGIFFYKGEIPADEVDAKYTSPESQFLSMDNGARVHFRDEGNPDAEAIVLVHGSNASLHTWEPWVVELGIDYRLVTMDVPARGLTGATPDRNYSSEAQLNTRLCRG